MAESEHSLEKSKGQMGDRVPNVEVVKKGERVPRNYPLLVLIRRVNSPSLRKGLARLENLNLSAQLFTVPRTNYYRQYKVCMGH